jgi:uncharacterized membrane protein
MSDLYVIGYPDAPAAEAVRDRALQLQRERLIELDDIVVVEHSGGKIKLRQLRSPTTAGAAGGAVWGGLIGLLFLVPLLGMAVGAGAGALAGSLSDAGVDDAFMKRLGASLPEGGAALFMLVRSATTDKVTQELAPMGGKLLRSSLTAEAEQALRNAAGAARVA